MAGTELTVTLIIIIITGIVSFQSFSNREWFLKLSYSPYAVQHNKQWYRIFTHAFVHADTMHLILNMYVLYIFGRLVEKLFSLHFEERGLYFYILLYIGGIMFAALPGIKKHRDNIMYRSVGASGAVAAVLFACILMAPTLQLALFFIIPMPAWVLGIGYLVYEYVMDKRRGAADRIAHDAHFWGALFGLGFTLLLKPNLALEFFDKILNSF